MADNVQYTAGANSTPPNATLAATDELADGSHAGIAKLAISADGDRTLIPATAADGLLVDVSNASLAVTGTVSVNEPVSVDDNGGSLTVDAPVGTPVNVQVGDGALTATIRNTGAADSLNVAVVDAAGNQITTFSGSGVSHTDDDPFAVGVDAMVPIGGIFDDTGPDSVDEGDAGAVRMSANRNLYSTIRDAAGNERGVNVTAGNALTVDGSAVTQPVSNAGLTSLNGAIAGTEVQVDVVGALPAGNNNIGDVDIASLPNEGQQTMANSISVAISSDQSAVPVSGTVSVTEPVSVDDNGGSLTVDAPVGTPVNVQVGDGTNTATVRNLAANDALNVSIVDGAGNQITTFGGSGGTSEADDADFTAGTTAGTPAMGVFESSPTSVTDGDLGIVGITQNRQLKVLEENSAGIEALLTTIDGDTGTIAGAVSGSEMQVDVVAALPAGTNNIGDVDIASLPNEGQQSMANSISVAIASDQSSVAVIGPSGGAIEIVGDSAADVAVPTNPVAVGGRASDALPTEVSGDGDAVYQWLLRNGASVIAVIPHLGMLGDPYTQTSETAQYTTTQTSTALVSPGGGQRIAVTSIQIQAGGTTAGTLQVYFGDGAYSRGTSLAIFDGEFAPSSTLKPGFAMAPPKPWVGGADEELRVTDSAAINPLTITVWYYLIG